MLPGGGLLFTLVISLLAPLANAGVKGFGIIFSVEPMQGSEAGGTEIHVAGAGFAYVTQVLVGGKPCHILEQMTKDGELTAFTPALTQGWHEVEVVFTSGHRAKLRDGKFRTHRRFTPYVESVSHASAVISNVTWRGDLKKTLEQGMNEIFQDTGEKRNATEIMHAYIGTGEEILNDKAGRDEFRCDILETKTEFEGVCEVSAGTPAGYYNFTYVLQNGVSMNGYGKSEWKVMGLPYVTLEGRDYAIEVYPTLHSLQTKQVGRLGGAPVYLEADGVFPGKGDFAGRHQVLLDGVPCVVEDIEDLGNTEVLRCIPGATAQRPPNWPKRLAAGSWAAAWEASEKLGPFPGIFSGTVARHLTRAWKVMDYTEFQAPGQICSGSRHWLGSTSSLEECAENCFFMNCKFFDFRRESRACRWCADVSADGTMATYDPGWDWHPNTIGGVYKLNTWMEKYLKEHANEGPNWKLLHGDGRTRCAGDQWRSEWQMASSRLGGFIQQCADWCSSMESNLPGGNCTYFGILGHLNWGRSSRCVIFSPKIGKVPETTEQGGANCIPEEDSWIGHHWSVFELTRETPMSPPPSGIYPGGRGALVRVWNLCPLGLASNDGCQDSRRSGRAALQASMNPEYRAQRPMFEVIRSDVLRGAFGFEHPRFSGPEDQEAYDREGPYKNMAEASGDHGIVEEIMAFFVAPVTGYYSFLTWGDQEQDVWLSQSSDPADLIKVARRFDYLPCRTSTRHMFTGCSLFYNYRSDRGSYHNSNQEAHQGTNLTRSFDFLGDNLGYRTPTEQTIFLTEGERRFFVKRTMLAEHDVGSPNSRRRRRARQFTGLRIQRPDLSEKTTAQKELLSQRKSWPETLLFKKIISKEDGQWRVGLRETAADEPTYSNWIGWNFNEWNLMDTLNAMVLPSGTMVKADAWWMDTYSTAADETVTEYLVHVWRPGGNLPPVIIDYDLMRSTVQVDTLHHGNPNELWLWPLSASLFEVPVLEPSAQLSVTGINALHSQRVTMEGNMSNSSDVNDTEAEIPFPCAGDFTSCSAALGCEFSTAVLGTPENQFLDAWQIYDTWDECQQRCCQDQDCFAVSYDQDTKYCKKLSENQDHLLATSATELYANVLSRVPSTDGFAAFRGIVEIQGVQVGAYPGHRSVTFCKEKCAAEPLCNHVVYHDTRGCFLRSNCVRDDSVRGDIGNADDQHWTFYKTRGRCTPIYEWSESDRQRVNFPADPFGSSVSTFAGARPNRRRTRWTRYVLGDLARSAWSPIEIQGARRLEQYDRLSSRRLAGSDCIDNCTSYCSEDVSDELAEVDCMSECMIANGCGNITSTYTQTSTTTTTLPPPPVRLVQLSGDIFSVGDTMPQEGAVSGRVEVFYDGVWGTVCKDGFDDVEAQVVCNELGLAGSYARFDESAQAGSPGSESQPIHIDDIDCSGDETHLSLCPKSAWGVNNCFHSEDAKVWCESTSTTATTMTRTTTLATTSTTTSFPLVDVTPRSGFLRQDLTGRCLTPASCSEGAALEVQECRLYMAIEGHMQYWLVDSLGKMESAGCPGMCVAPEGANDWSDRNLVLLSCMGSGDGNESLLDETQRRFHFPLTGFVQSQFSGKCMDTEGSNGRDSRVIQWRECEWEATCHKKGMKFEPLNMDGGGGRTSESSIGQCMSRCASVQGCAHFSYWDNGGCHLQNSSAHLIWDNNAYTGPPSCAEAVSDQKWTFVELDMTNAPTMGLLRNAETLKCVDPSDLDPSMLELQACKMHMPNTDQIFELTSDGKLRNIQSGLCANVTADSDQDSKPQVYMTSCDTDVSNLFQFDNMSQIIVAGDRCLNATGSSNGDTLQTVVCTNETETINMTLSWEFVVTSKVAVRCSQLCDLPKDVWDVWTLYASGLECECGHAYRQNFEFYLMEEGIQGDVQLSESRFGFLSVPDVNEAKFASPRTTLSSLAAAFTPSEVAVNDTMGLGVFSMALSLPQEIPESGDEPTTPFGFTYLNEAQQPYIDSISVDGNTDWGVNITVKMLEGSSVVINVRNFDGLTDGDVKVHLGLVVVPSVTVTPTSVSFAAPLTTHGEIVMKVMAGWKGWADFAPFLGRQTQEDSIVFGFDTLNEVTALSPSAGSMVGGAQVTITGRGFKLPGLSNEVTVYHYGGTLIGEMAGMCNVTSGSLTSIACQMPTFDLSHWSSTQFEERMELRVNGQSVFSDSTKILFTYSRQRTPIVTEVYPESLSFALTNNLTIVGLNLGLLKREVQVMFGQRSCKIWDVNETHISCQLKRSAMALPPLCTANRDIYNEDCVVKPHNFFQKPELLVTSRGYSIARNSSYLDTRFEIHSVQPEVGSEEGGAVVTVRGVGFGSKQLTPQLTIAALGTLGDVVSWSDTEVVFMTRKLTLNVEKVDLMVNLISAKHKCGTGPDPHPGTTTTTTMGQNISLLRRLNTPVSEDCVHKAFRAYATPNVTAVDLLEGNQGDTMTFTVSMPGSPEGYIVGVSNESVSVHLGSYVCPHLVTAKNGIELTITCTVPAFEASTVVIKVRILPLGYARMGNGLDKFKQLLSVDSISPNSGSKGGKQVTLHGKGFATMPARHFIRVGSDWWDVCEPITSNYYSVTCRLNYQSVDQGDVSGATHDVEVMIWDTEVAKQPLSAFGNTHTGCLRGENDWRRYNVATQEECALHCLTTENCKSFDFSARYQRCFMSDTSFTACNDCQDQRQKHCRYFERRTEADPTVAVKVTMSNFYSTSNANTPNVDLVYTLPALPDAQLEGTAAGCGPDAADLTSGNSGCCSESTPCGVNEGECSSSSRCAGDLTCISYSCSWTTTDVNMQDSCCVLQGKNNAFITQEPFWSASDRVYVRVSSLGDAGAAVAADPSGGAVNISFAGVPCQIDHVRSFDGQSWLDLGCQLGEVPGGLPAFPLVESDTGFALDQSTWIFTRLNITTAEPLEDPTLAASSSLGGGWKLNVTGTGFAPPKSRGADTFVEVSICGRPCEVVDGGYDWLECIVPNVTTPEVTSGASQSVVMPTARVLSRDAGTISSAPACFHGVGDDHFEVGHSTCAAVFDDDPEVVAGTTGTNCHVGLDFGKYTEARVEKIRWHPLYDFVEADSYINGKFQIGTLVEPQACDELSYGWRGVAYMGCQDISERGNPCKSWQDVSGYAMPALAGHSYCRNPLPGSRTRGIWCWLQRGGWEYCNPKMPEITWTDVYTIGDTPKMLWNDVVLSTPLMGRFVRFLSPSGNCQMQEMQVIGQLVAPSESCQVAVRNVQAKTGPNLNMDVRRLAWRGGLHYREEFSQATTEWVHGDAKITFSVNKTPTVTHIDPINGTARGGTEVTIHGHNFGPAWTAADSVGNETPVVVDFNGYPCNVQQVSSTSVLCVTVPRSSGIFPPSMTVTVQGAGNAWIAPSTRYRYLDRWSLLDTWANQEPPIEDALVSIPAGQAILLDEDTPQLLILTVEGVLVFDNKDIHLQATYIWVKGGTMEIGTEQKPFLHRALITLHGQKYETIRLPVIGGKVLAVSNTQFTIRELGDNAMEEGSIGTLDIHGKPRLKVWTKLARTAFKKDTVIVLQDIVDWKVGEELMIAATDIPHKHFDGNGLHGAPPMDFHNERVYIENIASDMKTITLTSPLKFTHISTNFTRPLDNEYIDLSAEVALLSRNVKIQGEAYHSERDQWGGHTMVAFGGVYRIENAEFYRLGQTGEVSRYPIHFHISQDYGQNCYARYNSIHHSFQRAVAIHSTNYVSVKGNVAFDIIGHMFFVETGMEMHNTLEGNLAVGAIPLLSGMLESDQEPAGFWTAAPNNVWRDNVAVTGSDGWYFQLPGTPISHNMDIYKDSICPVGTRIGEWRRNRCHHLPGSCIRIYLTWIPRKEPCNTDSAEDPQILFNTTCWGIGKACYNAMKMGSVHNHHMTAVEGGKQDYESIKFIRAAPAEHGNKFETDFLNIPHIKDSVFVGTLPENEGIRKSQMSMSVQLPQNEQFLVADSMWVNTGETPVFKGCAKCWSFVKWRQGAHTYRFKGLSFSNVTRRIQVYKKDIFWDLDGSLTGTANSYTSWADAFNLGHPDCAYTQVTFNTSDDGAPAETTWYSATGMTSDEPSIFKSGANIYQHEVRNHTFMTCTTPIRKFGLAWPEPQEVHLRQLTVTNLDTGHFQQHEFEKNEVFGWGFPVVANQRLEVRPNFLGMDVTEGGIQYGFNDLLRSKEADALSNQQTVEPEWLQLQVAFWMDYNHVKLTNPYSWWVGTRYGEAAELRSVALEEQKPYLSDPAPLNTPENLPSMTHGMKDPKTWAMNFRYPPPADAPAWETVPFGARFEARKCPDEGCILNLPDRNQNWTTYILWSEKFGDVTGQAIEIDAPDWILFDLDFVQLKNLTIKGKLSFDDSRDRTLRTGNILVWGVLEIGNETHPFGETTATTARVELTGNVLDTQDYVYIQEQSLWGKVISVIGQVNTYGAPMAETWLRLASSISATAETACVTAESSLNWTAGTEVAFSVTEWDHPYDRTLTRSLTEDAVYDSSGDCWSIRWSGDLTELRYAGDVMTGSQTSVSLRAVVARVDRSVVFTSQAIDTTGGSAYGGHIEIFDLTLDDVDATKWVGTVDMKYTRFHRLGKGALSAAVKVTYSSSFEPPPVLVLHGCSWTSSVEYALHLESSNVPTLITKNVMVHSLNGGIFLQEGSAVHMLDNAILGVKLADTAPRQIAEDDSQVIVMQYAGIRADVLPVRMIGNLVAGSDDMGYMHPAESCPPRGIFKNEAVGVVTGVFLHTQKKGSCQTINMYTIWKAAHVALYLSDVIPSQTVLANIVIADSHIGIIPYMSVGSAFRRVYMRNNTFIGTSPAGTDCGRSGHCRTQTLTDPYMQSCSSMYVGSGLRRVGFVTPIQTVNKKSCWTTQPAYKCRLMSPAMPTINPCHQPWEKDLHMQKGLGWTFFEDTTFAHWKVSDCGMTDRAIAPNMWGAEVNFPATFTRTTWYETDPGARFELSTETLDDSYSARASPCRSSGGGCMGLDQLLLQDMDGTLTGLDASPMATVLPLTPRTDIVWAPFCETSLDGVVVGAQVCANTTVDLLEMVNLDRGAKDIKFGPLVMTPDVPEDNGFEGGVLSSVGPFYASCPCGWDFSFYHILIKPDTTYYAEVMSLPENFRLRYWSPRPDDSVLLEIFYPDSRGVNVFVGGAKEPDMALKLGEKPTLTSEHGAHTVDAQALRLYITLRGSQEGFNAQRDLVVRRTPTVKLKMNIEISIEEFNADQFQTNLAILLGIPPERIVVAAVTARRRLALVDSEDSDEALPCDDCKTPRRRLQVSTQTALDVSISPSEDTAAAASGGDSTSTGTDALNAQSAELGQVSSDLQSLASGDELATAAGGTVVLEEIQEPAAVDEAANEAPPSAAETQEVEVIDITAVATSSGTAEVSATAPCAASFGVTVTVGTTSGIVYPQAEIASGETATRLCSVIDAGYQSSITLSCTAGTLKADVSACAPQSCTTSTSVDVTIGGTTQSISPSADLASGIVSTQACSSVNGDYTGNYVLYCNLGVLTYDVTTCSPGCTTGASVTLSVAGSTLTWNPSSTMTSGASETTTCEPINSGYTGTIRITCFFGVLTANPSGCSAKPCPAGSTVSVTLDGAIATVASGSEISSGRTGVASCTDVNGAWGNELTLRCTMGALSADTTNCEKACPAADPVTLTLGGVSTPVVPTATIPSGSSEFLRDCSEINSGYDGTYSLSCTTGTLSADLLLCAEKGCLATDSVAVTVGDTTTNVEAGEALEHGGSITHLCENINSVYTGTITIDCALGAVSLGIGTCEVRPCQPWDFVAATLHGTSGLLYPREQIKGGESGVGECGNVNIEYSGDFTMNCVNGLLQADSSASCRRTCSPTGSSTTVTLDGTEYTVTPASRIAHLGTGAQACGNVRYGYGGDVSLSCDDGTLSVTAENCVPEPCPVGLLIKTTIYGVTGIGELTLNASHGGTGWIHCHSINPETTGMFEATCIAKSLTLVNEAACQRSCTETSPANLELDGYHYAVAPVSMILHTNSSLQNCSAFSSGYTGIIELSCNDNVTAVVSHDCTPNPCPDPRTDENTTVEPYFAWTEQCITISPLLRGEVSYTCIGGMIRTNTTGCNAPCNETQEATIHGEAITVDCHSFLGSAYDGDVILTCADGSYSADSSACLRACLVGETDTVVVQGSSHDPAVTSRVASGSSQTLQCNTLDASYSGTFEMSCTNGVLSDTSDCNVMCLATGSVSATIAGTAYLVSPLRDFEHSTTANVPCSDHATGYAGNIVLSCSQGAMQADASGCMAPCTVGSNLAANFGGGSHTATLTSEVMSGTTGTESCTDVDSGFNGNLVIACDDGTPSQSSHTCTEKPCAVDLSYILSVGGASTTKQLTAQVAHAGTFTESCGTVADGWGSDITVTCIKGSLVPDASSCLAPCSANDVVTALQLGVDGEVFDMPLSVQIAHGAQGTERCSAAHEGFEGNVVLSCSNGVLAMNSNSCVEKGCAKGLSYNLFLGHGWLGPSTASELQHNGFFTQTCNSVDPSYDHDIVVRCKKGKIEPNYIGCVQACLPSTGGTVQLGPESEQVYPAERIPGNLSSFTQNCSVTGAQHQGVLEAICSNGELSVNHSCVVGCGNGKDYEVVLDGRSFTGQFEVDMFDQDVNTQACPSGFTGNITLMCNGGYAQKGDDTCVPLPCPVGATSMLSYDGAYGTVSTEAAYAHNESYTEQCAFVNSGYKGTFQATCKYGGIEGDFSTCVGDPCALGLTTSVTVGWQSLNVTSPGSEMDYGITYTVACSDINSEFTGDVSMTCSGAKFRADTSGCTQIEAGCKPTGKGRELKIINDTHVLLPSAAVAQGQNFARDCLDVTEGRYVGTISATCGALGRYTSIQVNCVPKSCLAGSTVVVSKGALEGSVTSTLSLAHNFLEVTTCDSADEGLRGELRLVCQYGSFVADTSSCEVNCLPSRPGKAILNNRVFNVTTVQELGDGNGFFSGCQTIMKGFIGTAKTTCNGGALVADVSNCMGLPCNQTTSMSANATLYAVTKLVSISQALAHEATTSFQCSSVNPDYSGNFLLECFGGELYPVVDTCVCEVEACSTAPCGSTLTFYVNMSGVPKTTSLGVQVNSLESKTITCDSVVAGHDGDMVVMCSGALLKPDTTNCMPRGCDTTTVAVEAIVGGVTYAVAAPKVLVHNERFVAEECADVNSGYSGGLAATCFLGQLVVDGGSCKPLPCQDELREVTVQGFTVTVRLAGSNLGSSSPAPSGFEGNGNCSQLDGNLLGKFNIGCTASVYSLDLSQCSLKSCEPPISATAGLGSNVQAMPIINSRQEGEKESFSCSTVSEEYSGVGYLVCGAAGLQASTSGCTCTTTACQSAGCPTTTGALMEKNGRIAVGHPPVPMQSGRSTELDCEVLPGHRGTASGSCSDGVFSADVTNCRPKPCTPMGTPMAEQVGSVMIDVVAPWEVASGGSWNYNCAAINPKYEGGITASCTLGEVSVQNDCFEAPCNDTSRVITLTDNRQMSIMLTGAVLGFSSRTPSAYNNTGINCGVFNNSIDGTASVVCSTGAYTLDASGCGPRGCTAGSSFLAQLGSRELRTQLDVALKSEESTTTSCASVLPGWSGDYTVKCSYGVIRGEGSGCIPGICPAGETARVVMGSMVGQLALTSDLNSFESAPVNCSTVNNAYEGSFSLVCEAAAVYSNTTGCTPVPVSGTVTQARQVVESAVAFSLPEVEATVEEMQAAMDTVAAKRAYELTLAESLGVDNEDVTVFSIQVYDATAFGRRLQAKTRLSVNVNFQLRTKGSQAVQEQQVTSLKSKIQDLGTSGSAEQETFAAALGTNLEEAVKVDTQNSALLRATAQAVKTEGVAVKHVETPRVSVTYVAVEIVEPEEPGPVIINIIAAILGIIAAGACAAVVIWQIKKRQLITPIAMLDEEAMQEADAEAPETPSQSQVQSELRSAGQLSPQSLQMRNAVNQATAQPASSPFANEMSRDPEPFWETQQDPEAPNAEFTQHQDPQDVTVRSCDGSETTLR